MGIFFQQFMMFTSIPSILLLGQVLFHSCASVASAELQVQVEGVSMMLEAFQDDGEDFEYTGSLTPTIILDETNAPSGSADLAPSPASAPNFGTRSPSDDLSSSPTLFAHNAPDTMMPTSSEEEVVQDEEEQVKDNSTATAISAANRVWSNSWHQEVDVGRVAQLVISAGLYVLFLR